MKETAEHKIFLDKMESYIKSGIALNEEQINELTELYSDYLKSYGEFVRAMHAKKDFKLGLVFATKIMLNK